MWFLIALYFYVIGGVVAGRAEYRQSSDRMKAIAAAFAWPAVPSKWLFNFVKGLLD